MTSLRASYRLQLRNGTTFAAARRLVDYLEQLGVSHLYLSPILHARRGSPHGYDAIDPTAVDPALGGEAGFSRLVDALRARGLGALLDIVPNHVAASPEGAAFDDVLRRGAASPWAPWFDIDWEAGGGRLVLPVLGRALAACVERGEIVLGRQGGETRVRYFERSFPLAPGTLAAYEAGRGGPRDLLRLLERQPYRLAHWREADRAINYRRFFEIADLISLRVEDPAVFESVHAVVLELVAAGGVDGLRIDHVDGLRDPRAYLRRLRHAVEVRLPVAGRRDFRLLVEKILARGERLPSGWTADGTTGYEFLCGVDATLLDPAGAAAFDALWTSLTRVRDSFDAIAREAKRRVLRRFFGGELERLRIALARLPELRSFEPDEIESAVVEAIAALPVYRTYVDARGLPAEDAVWLEAALGRADKEGKASRAALRALGAVLRLEGGRERRGERLACAQRFQQLSGPAAAKGVEDTALYARVSLACRNEVGAEPGADLAEAVAELHRESRERARRGGAGLLAASTHDTKRSADVRARLAVLSEMPDAWGRAVTRWREWNAPLRQRIRREPAPTPNLESLFYQTLVGVWPLPEPGRGAHGPPSAATLRALRARVEAYLTKAAREAKVRTSWRDPDPAYERALVEFVRGALGRPALPFVVDVARLAGEVTRPGLWNSLSRTLLQLASPGVPDLYQGDELWSFSLVDPDNRRPVDFELRRQLLRQVLAAHRSGAAARRRLATRLAHTPEDPRCKLFLIHAGLAARRRHPALFGPGGYRALPARGARAGHVIAFARSAGPRIAVAAAARLSRSLVSDPLAAPTGEEVWTDTALALPRSLAGRRLTCALTGTRLTVPRDARLPLARLFDPLPVALWVG